MDSRGRGAPGGDLGRYPAGVSDERECGRATGRFVGHRREGAATGAGATSRSRPSSDASVAIHGESLALAGQHMVNGRREEALAIYARIVEELGDADAPDARALVARALSEGGAFEELVDRFVSDEAEAAAVRALIRDGYVTELAVDRRGHVARLEVSVDDAPDGIAHFTHVRHLWISVENGVVPNEIGRLGRLERLPNEIGRLGRLERLTLIVGGDEPVAMPSSIVALAELKRLVWYGWGEVPEAIGNLTGLEELAMAVSVVPDAIGELRDLRQLDLAGKFTQIPDTIGELGALEFLRLSGECRHVPDAIGKLTGLRGLSLEGQFDRIPDCDGKLQNLESLEAMSGKGPMPFPAWLTRLTKIRECRTNARKPTGRRGREWRERAQRRALEYGI